MSAAVEARLTVGGQNETPPRSSGAGGALVHPRFFELSR